MRNYQRKTARPLICEDTVRDALRCLVQGKMSLRAAADTFKLTKSMLYKRLKCLKSGNTGDLEGVDVMKSVRIAGRQKYNCRQIFTDEEENRLCEYLVKAGEIHEGLTFMEARKLAFEFASKIERKHPASWRKNKMAGVDWLQSFKKRHPNLNLRKAGKINVARTASFNEINIKELFDDEDSNYNHIPNAEEAGIAMGTISLPAFVLPKEMESPYDFMDLIVKEEIDDPDEPTNDELEVGDKLVKVEKCSLTEEIKSMEMGFCEEVEKIFLKEELMVLAGYINSSTLDKLSDVNTDLGSARKEHEIEDPLALDPIVKAEEVMKIEDHVVCREQPDVDGSQLIEQPSSPKDALRASITQAYSRILCKETFSDCSSLREHTRTHTGTCGITYTYKSNLARHMQKHVAGNLHRCDVCKQSFSLLHSLKIHMQIHVGDKQCDICKKNFKTNLALVTHKRTHTGEKSFACNLCAKRFPHISSLTVHMKQHADEKPYKCGLCNKSFTEKTNLNMHMRKHGQEKPYECDMCHKMFLYKSSLRMHIIMHMGKSEFGSEVSWKKELTCSSIRV